MEQMDSNWLQAIHPRGKAAEKPAVKGAFQYNGGHGLTTFFVEVELAEPLNQQLAAQGLDPADTVTFAQQEAGDWVVAFADEAMEKKVEYSLTAPEMEALMSREEIHLVHV